MEIISNHKVLQAGREHKQRFGYMALKTICAHGIMQVNEARVVAISPELTEDVDIKKLMDVAPDGVENINYHQAIKRVTGMINKALAN